MKNAGAAMKQIHGGLTIDKVDATMDELREQHALGEEIASAITNVPLGDPVDETELEEELEGMEQEAMDERMLKSGSVPVGGEVSRLPSVTNGPSKWISGRCSEMCVNMDCSTRQSPGRRRRGRRASEAASGDGDVVTETWKSVEYWPWRRFCSLREPTSAIIKRGFCSCIYIGATRGQCKSGRSLGYRWEETVMMAYILPWYSGAMVPSQCQLFPLPCYLPYSLVYGQDFVIPEVQSKAQTMYLDKLSSLGSRTRTLTAQRLLVSKSI